VKVCVFGAGAIGGYLGVCLARSGAEVSLVARGPHLEAIRASGLRLQYDGEEHVAHLRCTDNTAELGEQDYLIIGLKAHQIEETVDAMVPLLGSSTCIVTASNGIPYWYFHGDERLSGIHFRSIDPGGRQWDTLGPERAIGCVVLPAAEVIAPGVIRHEHGRKFPIGEPGGQKSPRLERLHEAMVAGGLKAPVEANLRDDIWIKLMGNVAFNPISALTRGTLEELARDPDVSAVVRTLMAETEAVAAKLNIELPIVPLPGTQRAQRCGP